MSRPDIEAIFWPQLKQPEFYVAPITWHGGTTRSGQYLTSDAYITKKRPAIADLLRAVGETRTRTGLLPQPPQSSVSTISPPPLCLFWDCKGTTKKLNSKFFFTFFAKIFTFLFQTCFTTHSTHSFSAKSLYSHFYLLSLRAFPRVGSMVF